MAKLSRKSHRKHKTHRRRHSRRNTRRHGGAAMLNGAPLNYSDDWSSKMSNGQGADFLKYHVGQHGGAQLAGTELSAVTNSALPASLRGPAHIGALDRSFADIAGLKDQAGGKRRKHKRSRRHRKSSKKHARRSRRSKGGKSRKHSRRQRKSARRSRRSQGGAALGYAAFPSAGMLLDSAGYAKAGLTPEWKAGVEFDAAKIRQAL
jgi:hypothetical protein